MLNVQLSPTLTFGHVTIAALFLKFLQDGHYMIFLAERNFRRNLVPREQGANRGYARTDCPDAQEGCNHIIFLIPGFLDPDSWIAPVGFLEGSFTFSSQSFGLHLIHTQIVTL